MYCMSPLREETANGSVICFVIHAIKSTFLIQETSSPWQHKGVPYCILDNKNSFEHTSRFPLVHFEVISIYTRPSYFL